MRHIRPDGVIETVAGTGAPGYSGDGGPARQAMLYSPESLAMLPDGSLLIADRLNNVIRRVSSDGMISTFAGRQRFAGDGGPATSAILDIPLGIALDSQGDVFVSESFSARIRKIDLSGTISTYAGTGQHGQVRPGPATSVDLAFPRILAADKAGNIYFADSNVVWRETPDGTIARFAGTGMMGLSGDGGPAIQATFRSVFHQRFCWI